MMNKPVIVILGPTASGKTSLAVALARSLQGEIVSADSRQIYRGLDLGTGKDIEEYGHGVDQITHHLIDILEIGTPYSVAHYQRDAWAAINNIMGRSKQPILCGGTGLYIDSILNNYQFSQIPTFLQDRIQVDAKFICFGLNPVLDQRRTNCKLRLMQRLQMGLVREVEELISQGVQSSELLWLGLEYKWVVLYIEGKLSENEFVHGLTTAIQQFAKRQMTFFRKMERSGIQIKWIHHELSFQDKVLFMQQSL